MGFGRSFRDHIAGLLRKWTGVSADILELKVRGMQAVFEELDADVAHFQQACGFGCLKVCGRCCENPLVEATELEMLPLARAMVQDGTAEQWYLLAEKRDFSGRCIFFQPELKTGVRAKSGHCGVYDHRPLVCRLFSSSCNRDKYGRLRLVVCAPIRQAFGPLVEKAETGLLEGSLQAPVMATYALRATAIDPDMERERYPINMAFKRAVDRVWIHQRFI